MELEKILELIEDADISSAIRLLTDRGEILLEKDTLTLNEKYSLLRRMNKIDCYYISLPIMIDYLEGREGRYEIFTYDDILDEVNDEDYDTEYTEEEVMTEAIESGYFGCIFDW